jgi:uncharacterized protein (UPF0276 family)
MPANQHKNLGFGLGLRQKHVEHIIKEKPKQVDWFEVISENYFNPNSSKRDEVEKIRRDYPFVMHGVSMSIGSTDELNTEYLNKLKELSNWLEPQLISDHICWTGINNFNSHDLLPVPYIEESLKNMVKKVKQVQDFLGRRIALENPSTYLEFEGSQINEWDFIRYVAEEADCDLLLDVNNVYVNCFNHGYESKKYIDAIPAKRVAQIHLAGHKNFNTHIVDTHSDYIADEVLELYKYTITKIGKRSSMIEWDAEIPGLEVMISELEKVKEASSEGYREKLDGVNDKRNNFREHYCDSDLVGLYNYFQSNLLNPKQAENKPEQWVKKKDRLNEDEQFDIYSHAYRVRLFETIVKEYKASEKYLGEKNFHMVVRSYIEYQPSKFFNMDDYIFALPEFARKYVDDVSYELMVLEAEIMKLNEQRVIDFANKEGIVKLAEKDDFTLPESVKILKFSNDVNAVYKACFEDKISRLEIEDVAGKECFLMLTKEENAVYRTTLSKDEYLALSK